MNIYTARPSEKTFEFDTGIGLSEYAEVLEGFNQVIEKSSASESEKSALSARIMSDVLVLLPKNTAVNAFSGLSFQTSSGRQALLIRPGESAEVVKGASKAFVGVDAMKTLLVSSTPFGKELESLSAKYEDKQSVEYNAFNWLESGEVGRSSYALCYWLTTPKVVSKMLEHKEKTKGFGQDPHEFEAHPLDPSDFARCQKFLNVVPGARERIGEMKKVSEEWSGLVDVWSELEDIYNKEKHLSSAPELYSKMRSVLDCKPKNTP